MNKSSTWWQNGFMIFVVAISRDSLVVIHIIRSLPNDSSHQAQRRVCTEMLIIGSIRECYLGLMTPMYLDVSVKRS